MMIRALIKSESSRGGEVGFDASRQWKFNSCGAVEKKSVEIVCWQMSSMMKRNMTSHIIKILCRHSAGILRLLPFLNGALKTIEST